MISLTYYLIQCCFRRHNDVILLPAIHTVSGNDFVFQQNSAPAHRTYATVELLRQETPLATCGLQTAQISVLWITRSGLSCSIVSSTDKSIVWMNWNGGSSMSNAVLNSRLLTRLLTMDVEKTKIWFVFGFENLTDQKFDICSDGFPTETACNPPFK